MKIKKNTQKIWRKKLIFTINRTNKSINTINSIIKKYELKKKGNKITFNYTENSKKDPASDLLSELNKKSIRFQDLEIKKNNLEDIFINLVQK